MEVEPSLDIEHDVTSSPSATITEDDNNNLLDLLENVYEDENEDENPPVVPPLAPSSPPQLGPHCSTRIHHPPVPDDDNQYEVTSYEPKQKGKSANNIQVNVANIQGKEPEMCEEAMSGTDASLWKAACAEELLSFVKTNLYNEVERPREQKVVDCKWVFRIKHGPDGEIIHYKVRLVAKGFTQVEGIDYTETFTPVAKFKLLRILLTFAAHLDLDLHQMDIKTIYLDGDLDKEIFMHLPPGFWKPNVVWKLRKSLYGLKQAGCECYKKILTKFEKIGFTHCHSDHGVIHLIRDGKLAIIAIYVNDLLILSDSSSLLTQVKSKLGKRFEMTDLGEAC